MGKKPVSPKIRKIAKALVSVTEWLLEEISPVHHWADTRKWDLHKELNVKISWGFWATHAGTDMVQYGTQMIDFALGRSRRYQWDTVTKEMHREGWFDRYGDCPAVQLAVTVCHEVAHSITCYRYRFPHGWNRGDPKPHGKRWREIYRNLVTTYVEEIAQKIAHQAGEDLLEPRGMQDHITKVCATRTRTHKRLGNFRKGDPVEVLVHPWDTYMGEADQWVAGRIERCTATRYKVSLEYSENEIDMPELVIFKPGNEIRRPKKT